MVFVRQPTLVGYRLEFFKQFHDPNRYHTHPDRVNRIFCFDKRHGSEETDEVGRCYVAPAGRILKGYAAGNPCMSDITKEVERMAAEAEAMEALERASLARLGIADPYGATLTEEMAAANE